MEKLQKQLNEILSNLKESVKGVYPQLKASYDKLFHECMNILDAAAKLANTYLKAVLDLINRHQKELQDLMSVVSGITQDFAKIITKSLEKIKRDLEEFGAMLANQLKALPIYEMAKERLEELKNFQLPESVLGPIQDLCNMIKNALPTEELRLLADATCQYIVKHVKREKVRLESHIYSSRAFSTERRLRRDLQV